MLVGGMTTVNVANLNVEEGCDIPVPPLTDQIRGVIIFATTTEIDGQGGTLGRAGPCLIRTSNALPLIGVMEFDVYDVDQLPTSALENVIVHEMMHVLGFGTLWDLDEFTSLRAGVGTNDPRYVGASALQACRALGGINTCAVSIPVENAGGAGTQDSHWRESVFNNELMTGFLNAGVNPISRMSIGAMQDLGYTVNMIVADDYSVAAGLRMGPTPLLRSGQWEQVKRIQSEDLELRGNYYRVRWR